MGTGHLFGHWAPCYWLVISQAHSALISNNMVQYTVLDIRAFYILRWLFHHKWNVCYIHYSLTNIVPNELCINSKVTGTHAERKGPSVNVINSMAANVAY